MSVAEIKAEIEKLKPEEKRELRDALNAEIELSDSELLVAAEKTGTFRFLEAPAEDGYNALKRFVAG
jgi:hypothetical protein